ncbi:MAG: ribonuclease D [Gemmataceae bacterium]|nr:ribonuclease D [Gemmataceae bacterium]
MATLPEHIVSRASDLSDCCAHLESCSVIGFDTEFIGENTYHPRLCLVQVATPERLYLIDPLSLDNLDPFWQIVAHPDRVAVVHAGREEVRMCRLFSGRAPENVFDLQVAAGLLGAGYPAGHGALVHHFLRVRLSKGETLTDWARRPLTKQQLRYAYDDVRYLLPIYNKITRKLGDLGRAPWVVEEHSGLIQKWLAEDPDREPWRKLRGLGGMDGRQLATVRELYAWRDARAEKLNRPARFLLRDDLIIELARRLPTAERDISVVRGVSKNDVPALLDVIARGMETPPERHPEPEGREHDPPQVASITALMQSALATFCAGNRLTPALVATASDIKALVRSALEGTPLPDSCALASGWRAEFVLPVLRDVLAGRRALRVADINKAMPLELVESPVAPDQGLAGGSMPTAVTG